MVSDFPQKMACGSRHTIRVIKANPETVKSLKASYDEFWNDVSRKHGEISRFSIGAPQENPTSFTAHDWFGASFFSQKSIANLKTNFPNRADSEKPLVGVFKVYVEQDGWYQISLRRWPAEADKPINAAYIGKSIHAEKAVLEIEGQKLTMDIPENAKEVTFRIKLKKGDADLTAYFITNQKPLGAFYVYVLYEGDKPVKKGWQTREGLGLPEAVWPAEPGKDTTK